MASSQNSFLRSLKICLERKKHTPAAALQIHFHDIKQEFGYESYEYLGDGVYTLAKHYWFGKLFEGTYGVFL